MPRAGSDRVTSRRDFLAASGAALAAVAFGGPAEAEAHMLAGDADAWTLFIGTYTNTGTSQGIYRTTVDPRALAFGPAALAAATRDPSFLALTPNRRTLLAVNERVDFKGARAGSVSAFALRDGAVIPVGPARSSRGGAPCYVTVNRTGTHALVANYVGGNVAVLPIGADGSLGDPAQVVAHTGTGPNRTRQEAPHAHCLVLDAANRFAIAADLGADRLFVYRFDATRGALAPADVPYASLPPGAGPRHVAFAPNGRTLYCANELDSTLAVFAYAPTTGALTLREVVRTRPADATGANFPADLHVHPSGRTVYLSNRGDNTITVFAVAPDTGAVSLVQTVPSGGDWPRNFTLTPDGRGLLVAHQRSDAIVAFRIDERSGQLTPTGQLLRVPVPVCLVWA